MSKEAANLGLLVRDAEKHNLSRFRGRSSELKAGGGGHLWQGHLLRAKEERGRALLPSQSGRDKRDWRGEWREGRQKREEVNSGYLKGIQDCRKV